MHVYTHTGTRVHTLTPPSTTLTQALSSVEPYHIVHTLTLTVVIYLLHIYTPPYTQNMYGIFHACITCFNTRHCSSNNPPTTLTAPSTPLQHPSLLLQQPSNTPHCSFNTPPTPFNTLHCSFAAPSQDTLSETGLQTERKARKAICCSLCLSAEK